MEKNTSSVVVAMSLIEDDSVTVGTESIEFRRRGKMSIWPQNNWRMIVTHVEMLPYLCPGTIQHNVICLKLPTSGTHLRVLLPSPNRTQLDAINHRNNEGEGSTVRGGCPQIDDIAHNVGTES